MSDMLLYNIFDSAAVCTDQVILDKLKSIPGLKLTDPACKAAVTCAVECEEAYETAKGAINCEGGEVSSTVEECTLKSKIPFLALLS